MFDQLLQKLQETKGTKDAKATIGTIKGYLDRTFLAPQTSYIPGTVLRCVEKPYNQKFPEPGDLVVVVAMGPCDAFATHDGAPQSAGDLGNFLFAKPHDLGQGFGIWRSHTAFFAPATEQEILSHDKALEDEANPTANPTAD